ncbi:hypothetical protein ACC785_22660 [Rhizobium ruizarguesonis]
MKSFSATLPFPPSANNLFLNVKRGGRVETAKYRAREKQGDAAMPSGIVKLQGAVIAVRGDCEKTISLLGRSRHIQTVPAEVAADQYPIWVNCFVRCCC